MKQTLEKLFDIPFVYEAGMDPYPWAKISPKGERGRMFSIKVTNRLDVRLVIEFEPQAFSAPLIGAMGLASADKRQAFCEAASLQASRGASIEFSVNGLRVNAESFDSWPEDAWTKLAYKAVVIVPEATAGNALAVADLVREWGCLAMGMFLSLVQIEHVGEEKTGPQTEGDKFSVLCTRYERSLVNRYLCIKTQGCVCKVCGFDFAAVYGSVGAGYIHVHHVVPVSQIGPGYRINPETDLVPVCANCHAMLHRNNPPYKPDELKGILAENRLGATSVLYADFKRGYSVAAETTENPYGV